jgi:CheY-like chemotaxis protein
MPTVLLVDDEPQILKLLVLMLRQDYTVITAQSGIEALSIYASYPDRIDLIITDVTMPGMSGIEWVKRVEALYRRRLPVIFISGASDAPLDPKRQLVRKPFTPAALKGAIQRALAAEAGQD